MSDPSAPNEAARPRVRGLITTLLMIMLAIMIVRDILARRFSSTPTSSPDVTRPLS